MRLSMADLVSIPAELKLWIAKYLAPDDCFRLAISCKSIFTVCEPVISRNRALSEDYRRVKASNYDHVVWKVLKAVLDEADCAWHVREVELCSGRGIYYDPKVWYYDRHSVGLSVQGNLNANSERPPPQDVVRYVEAALDEEFLVGPIDDEQAQNGTGRDELINGIEIGSDGPIVAMLLLLLPRLRVLRYSPYGDYGWLLNALKKVASAYQRPNGVPHLPLQCLTKVWISHWDTEGCASWLWVYHLIQIPSLRSFRGNMIGGELEDVEHRNEEVGHAEVPMSNVTELVLYNSCFSGEVMDMLLSHFKCLESLGYVNGGGNISYSSYDPRMMIGSLLRYCSDSLKHLVLIDEEEFNRIEEETSEAGIPCPLRGFKRLETVECEFRDIMREVDDEDEDEDNGEDGVQGLDPRELFPASLECLVLEDSADCFPTESRVQLLERLLKAKGSSFPRLRQAWIPDVTTPSSLDRLKEIASPQGVQLTIADGSMFKDVFAQN